MNLCNTVAHISIDAWSLGVRIRTEVDVEMEVVHVDKDLERIESDSNFNGGLDHRLVRAFRKVMNIIRSVSSETELYAFKSLHFEKLKGDRNHQRSLRLLHQWRLIIEIVDTSGQVSNVCYVIEIVDYH